MTAPATARRRAVVVGTVSVDLVAGDVSAPTAQAAVGNSGANIAVRLAADGWDVEMVALVGHDAAADLLRADLERWGVGTTGVVGRVGYLTPRVFQVADAADGGGSPSLLLECPRCGRPRGHLLEVPRPDELGPDVARAVREADLLVVDVADATTVELARVAQDGGTLVWFEASLRECLPPAMRDLAARSDVVKVSSEDLDHYTPALDSAETAGALRVVTEGAEGVRYAGRGGWSRVPSALDQPPVDTIGAGDAFTAAAAAALVDGATPEDALVTASRAAAKTCLHLGARGDMLLPRSGGTAWIRDDAAFRCGRCEADPIERQRPRAAG
ncbi:MAG: hypothetical protein CMH83_22970 [Nocardioides sp.]|nr:hypothetical protein [Nocardioides sp.]